MANRLAPGAQPAFPGGRHWLGWGWHGVLTFLAFLKALPGAPKGSTGPTTSGWTLGLGLLPLRVQPALWDPCIPKRGLAVPSCPRVGTGQPLYTSFSGTSPLEVLVIP